MDTDAEAKTNSFKQDFLNEVRKQQHELESVQASLAINYINVFRYDREHEFIEYEFGWANKYDNGRPSVWTRAVFDPVVSYPTTADAYRALLDHVQAVRQLIEERRNNG